MLVTGGLGPHTLFSKSGCPLAQLQRFSLSTLLSAGCYRTKKVKFKWGNGGEGTALHLALFCPVQKGGLHFGPFSVFCCRRHGTSNKAGRHTADDEEENVPAQRVSVKRFASCPSPGRRWTVREHTGSQDGLYLGG